MRPLFWFLAVTMAFSAICEVAFATSLSLAACWTKLPLLQIDGLYNYIIYSFFAMLSGCHNFQLRRIKRQNWWTTPPFAFSNLYGPICGKPCKDGSESSLKPWKSKWRGAEPIFRACPLVANRPKSVCLCVKQSGNTSSGIFCKPNLPRGGWSMAYVLWVLCDSLWFIYRIFRP